MGTRNVSWFGTNVQYERQAEDGPFAKVGETYMVDAFTFGEAEDTIAEEMASYSSDEFITKNITPVIYSEIFSSDREADDKQYKAKLMFIAISEEKGKEKHTAVSYLVQAKNIRGALQNIGEVPSGSVLDYVAANVLGIKIMDVFEYDLKEEPDD